MTLQANNHENSSIAQEIVKYCKKPNACELLISYTMSFTIGIAGCFVLSMLVYKYWGKWQYFVALYNI